MKSKTSEAAAMGRKSGRIGERALCCDSCGHVGHERDLHNPGTGRNQKVVLCSDCFTYWSSEEGQASLLEDVIEMAERRAGWDASR